MEDGGPTPTASGEGFGKCPTCKRWGGGCACSRESADTLGAASGEGTFVLHNGERVVWPAGSFDVSRSDEEKDDSATASLVPTSCPHSRMRGRACLVCRNAARRGGK